jgi:hypothetical protein
MTVLFSQFRAAIALLLIDQSNYAIVERQNWIELNRLKYQMGCFVCIKQNSSKIGGENIPSAVKDCSTSAQTLKHTDELDFFKENK